jgi:hypothetical protein
LGAVAVWTSCVFCAWSSILAPCFKFKLTSDHSIALRRTFTGSTLAFAVACASPVSRESNGQFSSTALSDSDRDIYCSLVLSTVFRHRCPDLKESVMSLLPYTKGAMSVHLIILLSTADRAAAQLGDGHMAAPPVAVSTGSQIYTK